MIFSISFGKHSDEYDFFGSDFIIDNFLSNLKGRLVPSVDNQFMKIKCSFSLIKV